MQGLNIKQTKAVVEHKPRNPNHVTVSHINYAIIMFDCNLVQTLPKVPDSAGPIAKPKQKATSPMA